MNTRCFIPTDILLPMNTNMTKWSVVACDQYTSQPEYWQEVEKITSGSMSTYKITLPEIYLESDNVDSKISDINRTMLEYIPKMKQYDNAFIQIERTLQNGKVRRGIVGAVDLEEYDYSEKSTSAVRATERTVTERIPPRQTRTSKGWSCTFSLFFFSGWTVAVAAVKIALQDDLRR